MQILNHMLNFIYISSSIEVNGVAQIKAIQKQD